MCAQGFYEAMTLAFYADADLDALHIAPDAPERNVIRIVNPISSNLTIMRSLLAPSLLNVAVTNLKKATLLTVCLSFPTFMCPNNFR